MKSDSTKERLRTIFNTTLIAAIGHQPLGCYATAGDLAPLDEANSFMPDVGPTERVHDFGRYKEILQNGGIPGPNAVHSSDLFGDHELSLPIPDCQQSICLHASLGMHPSFSADELHAAVLIDLHSDLTKQNILPDSPDHSGTRTPIHLSVAIDTSKSMAGERLEHVKAGLRLMLAGLTSEDRVSVTAFSEIAEVLTEYQNPDSPYLAIAIDQIPTGASCNLFDGLYQAYELAQVYATQPHQHRVFLISDGEANHGITNPAKISDMSQAYNRLGLSLSTLGIGTDFNANLLRELAQSGAGSFYFSQNLNAIHGVFSQETQRSIIPLAKNVEVSVQVFDGHDLGNVYGTQRTTLAGSHLEIEFPLLNIVTHPISSSSVSNRPEGSAAIILELYPTKALGSDPRVAQLNLSYENFDSGDFESQTIILEHPLSMFNTRSRGSFSHPSAIEAFAMLNFYQGMHQAAHYAALGWNSKAIESLEKLNNAGKLWISKYPDPEVEMDRGFAELFLENLLMYSTASNP